MKIKLDIDCTPDEMREFFGLPEIKPLQEELLKEVRERLSANIKATGPRDQRKRSPRINVSAHRGDPAST